MTETLGTWPPSIDEVLSGLGLPEPAQPGERRLALRLGSLATTAKQLAESGRFVTLTTTREPASIILLVAVHGELVELAAGLEGATQYPAVSAQIPAAAWAEREVRDLTGLQPSGLPGAASMINPDVDAIERRLSGDDAFVMPYGPVRSGVFEAIQFVIETGGEDIPLLTVRTGFKRRELERRLRGMSIHDGQVVAERVAGISSVAHALAYAQAVERALGVAPPRRAELWRVIHAELERMANHLHSAAQLAETTALHLGSARFTLLKEEILRLRAELCGNRFGRGVVIPGGVTAEGSIGTKELAKAIDRFDADYRRDRRLLVGTTSFTDRLFGTGHLPRPLANRYAVVGPVARGSGVSTDARFERPYGAYARLGWELVTRDAGDAMARLEVRLSEIAQSMHLIRQAADDLAQTDSAVVVEVPAGSGLACGWAESAQGEVLYRLVINGGEILDAHIASPSFRNWQVFAECFPRDVLTDFGFIEHSFQITPAGADR
jgi:formate hydrogenlyase subunit 5